MTPDELETVRERCNVEGKICLEANKSCSPELWESVLAAPKDRFDLLAHIDEQEAEIKRLKEKYDRRGQYLDKLMAALEAAKGASDAED